MRLRDIATLVDGTLEGDGDVEITGLAKIEDAGPGELTFLANPKYRKYLATTSAAALLVGRDAVLDLPPGRTQPLRIIRVQDPYQTFQHLADVFYPSSTPTTPGIHPSAVLAASADIGKDVAIGPHVVVGERSRIGPGCDLRAGVVIGDDVAIGAGSVLYPNVVVREGCSIGKNVIIHSCSSIGSDGFGFSQQEDGTYRKIPQRGIVVIEDDVEIGANCSIDRATFGETRIRRGAKLDNLIHVAHNVTIGEDTVIAAQSGISGSTKVGNQCQIGGQVGLSGHLTIADRTTIGAKSGVPKSIEEEGQTWFGYPSFPIHETLRIQAATRLLPGLIVEVRALVSRIRELERQLAQRT